MPVLCVNYDLCHEDGHTYDKLIEAMGQWPAHCHALESCWLIATELTPYQVLHYMQPHLHKNDKVVIVQLERNSDWLTYNTPEAKAFLTKWIKSYPPKKPAGPAKPPVLKRLAQKPKTGTK